MDLILNEDVKAVAEFMQQNIRAGRLVSIAEGLAKIAPSLWGQYQRESIETLRLVSPSITAHERHTQSSASE